MNTTSMLATVRSGCALFVVLAVASAAGCSDDSGVGQAQVCKDYLACAAKKTPEGYAALLQSYGPDGTCWKLAETAAQCETACHSAMAAFQHLPDLPPECNYTPRPDGGTPDAGVTDLEVLPDLPKPTPGQPVDILLVIDNSGSMENEQQGLLAGIESLIEGLRDTAGKLPSVRVGVVTSDLGAGAYSLPSCEVTDGDRGKLQNRPRLAGCKPPRDPWVQLDEHSSINVDGAAATVASLSDTLTCIGHVGIQGCGFEFTLEAARRALQPQTNPGFLRDGAALLVLFITDEDDCSARNPQLFDPQQLGLKDPLGPLTSFRCFEFGISCDVNDRMTDGERKNCKPAFDWLYSIHEYAAFYSKLNRPVKMGAIFGPTSPVTVGKDGPNPVIKPSCQSGAGSAVPAIRINALIEAFNGVTGSVCDISNYRATLTQAAKQLAQ